jgi:uncharacterized membrane protein (DUF2068 family)
MTHSRHRTDRKGLLLIAAFKYLKAISLVVIGLGALRLVHKDLSDVVLEWAKRLHLNPENRQVAHLMERLGGVGPKRILEIAIGTLAYSALLFTEGTGLFLEKRWAEYLTIVATSVFVPFEMYELFRAFTLVHVLVLVVNLLIIGYLVWVVRGGKHA